MAALLWLLFGANLLFSAYADSVEDELLDGGNENPIVGGEPIKIDQAPYLAQLLDEGSQICGSSILNEYWIVTAAHCVEDEGDYSILTGSTYRSTGRNRHKIHKIIVHEGYNKEKSNNDIALIKLKARIKFDAKQKPISILKREPESGDQLKVAGFGRIGTNKAASKVLLSVVVPVVHKLKCTWRYLTMGDVLTDNMFCAGEGERDSCQGDSGGPAVIDEKLAGVVSFGYDCASDRLPGVYTKVINYVDWIEKNTGLKL